MESSTGGAIRDHPCSTELIADPPVTSRMLRTLNPLSAVDLTVPPAALTPRQRLVFWAVLSVCAATRFLAVARSLWEWDETLFCLALRDFDVARHQPHPPGFPLFIAMAKLIRPLAGDDFRALQSISVAAAMAIFPAMFLVARELRFSFPTSTIAAALLAFFPNVWFFGGSAFSDVFSIVLVMLAVAMLLRGCRDANAYMLGAFLLGLAIGVRPQNVLIGAAPGLLATVYRARESIRDVLFAALVGLTTVAVAFGGAVYATGSVERYLTAVHAHGEYISTIDSFRSPIRPALWRLFDRFFIKLYQSNVLSAITSLMVVISVAGAIRSRDRRLLLNAVTFAPFALFAWLMLDRYSITRFSIGYAPMFAIFAADGIRRVARGDVRREAAAGALLVAAFFVWTLPVLAPVRNENAPTVEALAAVKRTIDPRRDHLLVGASMVKFVDYFAPHLPYTRVLDERAIPLTPVNGKRLFLLADIVKTEPRGLVFAREKGRLWHIARRQYFTVALQPLVRVPTFGEGWYGAESGQQDEWRWMSGRSETILPPASGRTKLRIFASLPRELVPHRPRITVALNGTRIAQFAADGPRVEREWNVLPAAAGRPNLLVIEVSRTINPANEGIGDDRRDLGLQVRFLSWGKA